jgi:hypothetical protein
MLKESRLWKYEVIKNSKHSYLDLGFLGVSKYLPNSHIPHKKSKLHKLTDEQKIENKILAQARIKIENINREIKIFRITKELRRHKQKKHNLFWNLVAGIVNLKLRN